MPGAGTSRSIGEAARRLDEPFRRAHPEIPWSSLVGTRNIVMHDYEYLQPHLIRDMAEKDVPELLARCLRLLSDDTRCPPAAGAVIRRKPC